MAREQYFLTDWKGYFASTPFDTFEEAKAACQITGLLRVLPLSEWKAIRAKEFAIARSTMKSTN